MSEETNYQLQQDMLVFGKKYFKDAIKTESQWEKIVECDIQCFTESWFKKVEEQEGRINLMPSQKIINHILPDPLESEEFKKVMGDMFQHEWKKYVQALKSFIRDKFKIK